MRRLSRRKSRMSSDESYSKLDKTLCTIYIMGEISPKVASDFRRQLRTLERTSTCDRIVVEINSIGGDIEAGFMIIDTIELCTKPVTTRVTGVAMSMATLILAAGQVRESLPNALIMAHQGSYRVSTNYAEFRNEFAEVERVERVTNEYLEKRTGKPSGFWEKLCDRKNLYLNAEEALNLGLITLILRRT